MHKDENKILEKQDKTEEDYVDRIQKLMAAGLSSRTRKNAMLAGGRNGGRGRRVGA